MALAKRIQEQQPAIMHGKPCSIGTLLAQLDGKERDALLVMLGTREQPGWSQSQIYDVLTDEGFTVGRQSINKHRGGRCRCPRVAA